MQACAARTRGLPTTSATPRAPRHVEAGAWPTVVITLSRSLIVPFLVPPIAATCARRYSARGPRAAGRRSATTVRPSRADPRCATGIATLTATRICAVRIGRSHGGYARGRGQVARVWGPRRAARPGAPRAAGVCTRTRRRHQLDTWDWRYYAEKVRASRYHVDAAALKSYFALDRMTEAMFDCARRLFGIRFVLREGPAGLSSRRARVRGARPR